MSGVVRLGVLGCSEIADRRALPAVAASPLVETAAVASRDPERARAFADRHGGRPGTYEDVIKDPDVGAVYVSTPLALHGVWAGEALRAGKHVLCEKPLTGEPGSTGELVGAARASGLVLRENFTFLHHPRHRVLTGLLDDGRLGDLRTLSATFGIPHVPAGDIRLDPALGGGALNDVGVYPLRLAQALLPGPLQVVGATSWTDPASGVDVAGHVLLRNPAGVVADLDFGFRHRYRNRYALWTSTAWLELERAFTPPAGARAVVTIDEQDSSQDVVLPACDQFRESVEDFARAVLRGPEEESRWLDAAVETARLLDDVRRFAVQHKG
ncbi:Gfo/Idh/MocA family protein [Pseudonocardia endophytica]|uniref:Putative dehydrogenase n=1 Tax=Pseudonocardia endophytica TaxID=401976 RepID=A0A4R1HUA2_PSEEN|nr:Gfo/Idh/MocA family oxidoreductase [Pseudonocardia endophytica]TCK24515.1 putative dehydrogenase [Pseudonocardia endophytica]